MLRPVLCLACNTCFYISQYIDSLVPSIRVSQKFWNILLHANVQWIHHVTKALQAMDSSHQGWQYCGSRYTDMLCIASLQVWFESHTDIQCSLIWELVLSEFKLSHNINEVMKNFCCAKGAVDHCTIMRWFKKFCLDCKNLENQGMLSSLYPWIPKPYSK